MPLLLLIMVVACGPTPQELEDPTEASAQKSGPQELGNDPEMSDAMGEIQEAQEIDQIDEGSVDWSLVSELESAADELERVADTARLEVMAIGEVEGDAMPGRRELEADWTLWSREWMERMANEPPSLPNIPLDTRPAELLYAQQAIGRGWHELSILPITAYSWTNVPAMYERERHLDAVATAVEEARQLLRDLE